MNLEALVWLYPQLFSEKRMAEWQGLFDEGATMVRIEQGLAASFKSLRDAMPEQQEYADENRTFIEEWSNVEIHHYGSIAVVKADYVLTVDREIRKGVDVLTVAKCGDNWRIINLAYEQTELLTR